MPRLFIPFFGRNETVGAEADQIGPAVFYKRPAYIFVILRTVELQKRALHAFFPGIRRNKDRLHRERIETGVKHHRGSGVRRRIKVLHLLRRDLQLTGNVVFDEFF